MDLLLEYLANQKHTDIVVIGINNLLGDIEDPKWLKDAKKLSLLNDFNNIWLCGNCGYVIEKIISNEVLDKNKIEVIEPLSKAIEKTINSNLKVAMLLNYTCLMDVRNVLVKKELIKNNFWER